MCPLLRNPTTLLRLCLGSLHHVHHYWYHSRTLVVVQFERHLNQTRLVGLRCGVLKRIGVWVYRHQHALVEAALGVRNPNQIDDAFEVDTLDSQLIQ